MTNPLHASHYADIAQQCTVNVVQNQQIARDTWRLRFECAEIARRVIPGQFLMIRLSHLNDPLIGRPLAVYNILAEPDGRKALMDVVYLVKGKFTKTLARCGPGQQITVWGPLGNGFPAATTDHLIMVAGGIGQTPFLTLAQEYQGQQQYGDPARTLQPARKVTLCYGARSADLLAGVEDFRGIGVDVRLCTDDGSLGHHGLVTDLVRQVLNETDLAHRIVCCGPEPMMEAVADVADQHGSPCQISLETPMACGIGICFTCVAKVKDNSGRWDYKRTCVEGPVFDAQSIVW
jgi:dihydroorotate dehydrogenase electron transfer subunit